MFLASPDQTWFLCDILADEHVGFISSRGQKGLRTRNVPDPLTFDLCFGIEVAI